MTTAISTITRHAKKIADGKHDRIRPGLPFRIPDSWMPGDAVAQGDLIITVIDKVPAGYVPHKSLQLVPGTTQGSRHCLESLDGLKLFKPKGWPQSAETDYCGPVIVAEKDVVILHPVHGAVTVPAGVTVSCHYQKEYDQELKRSRRNAD